MSYDGQQRYINHYVYINGKSVTTAFILAIMFGPIGILYSKKFLTLISVIVIVLEMLVFDKVLVLAGNTEKSLFYYEYILCGTWVFFALFSAVIVNTYNGKIKKIAAIDYDLKKLNIRGAGQYPR